MPTPPKAVRDAARQGLSDRRNQPKSRRGGTSIGVARARDLSNGRNLPESTLERIVGFFSRNARYAKEKTVKQRQAWALWGGDAGKAWAQRELAKLKRRQG
jgi:hypothetical protein